MTELDCPNALRFEVGNVVWREHDTFYVAITATQPGKVRLSYTSPHYDAKWVHVERWYRVNDGLWDRYENHPDPEPIWADYCAALLTGNVQC